jgi:hypothetical protein
MMYGFYITHPFSSLEELEQPSCVDPQSFFWDPRGLGGDIFASTRIFMLKN